MHPTHLVPQQRWPEPTLVAPGQPALWSWLLCDAELDIRLLDFSGVGSRGAPRHSRGFWPRPRSHRHAATVLKPVPFCLQFAASAAAQAAEAAYEPPEASGFTRDPLQQPELNNDLPPDKRQRKPFMPLDFNDFQEAAVSKKSWELMRSWGVFTVCQVSGHVQELAPDECSGACRQTRALPRLGAGASPGEAAQALGGPQCSWDHRGTEADPSKLTGCRGSRVCLCNG